MKKERIAARQLGVCWISSGLAVCLAGFTFLKPEALSAAPLMVGLLLRPLLLLLIAGVNYRGVWNGCLALCAAKPERHTIALLISILAAVFCALGVYPDTALSAALVWTMCAWTDWGEYRLAEELPGAYELRDAAAIWGWAALGAALCAGVVWALHAEPIETVLCRAICVLAAAACCPLRLIDLLAYRQAIRKARIHVDTVQTIEKIGSAETVLLYPAGLLTGEPSAAEIRPAGMEEPRFLALAASIIQGSELPGAQCVADLARSRGLPLERASEQRMANGIYAVIDGRHYYAGTPEQLRRHGIFVPRMDEVALSGKQALCFGAEGGMYLGMVALQSQMLPGGPSAAQALKRRKVRILLPGGDWPLYTKQLAGRIGAEIAEDTEQEQEHLLRMMFGAPCAKTEKQTSVLTVQTLAAAADVLAACHRAVQSRRILQGIGAACAILLAGAAGGLLAPAIDFGMRPVLCALFGSCAAGILCLPMLCGSTGETEAERTAAKLESELLIVPEPAPQKTEAHMCTIHMDELPSVPGKSVLEQALLAVPGVQSAEADYENGLILVSGTAEKETLLQAIAEAANT